jgi:CRISPR/Cas system-associated exonuclease Cas4 (RecB family)
MFINITKQRYSMYNFPTKQIDHLSYSQIDMYSTCPLSWWFEYVLEFQSTKSVYIAMGSAIHTALSDYFQDKLLGIRAMSANELVIHAAETIKTVLAETKYELPKRGQTLDEIVASRLLGLQEYMDTIGSNLTVKFTEKKLKRVIPGTAIDFVGVIDLITTDRTILDFKVVRTSWSQNKARSSLQPYAYAFLLGRPIEFEIHCISAKAPSKVLPISVTQRDIDSYADMSRALSFSMSEVAAGRQTPERSRNSSDCYMCSHKAACDLHRYGLFDDLMELVQARDSVMGVPA